MAETNIPAPPDRAVPVDDLAPYIDAYRQARANVSGWTRTRDQLRAFLVDQLGERAGTVGLVNGRRVLRITEYAEDTFNKTKFGEQYPDLLAQFTAQADRRRLTVSDEETTESE